MPNKERGLYNKFTVTRNDGRDAPGGDRENADLFVLDLTNDPYALVAITAYASSCKEKYPQLSKELMDKVDAYLGMDVK